MDEHPTEWLMALSQGDGYAALLAEHGLAAAAYRVAMAKLATSHEWLPLLPTRLELHVAAREILARTTGGRAPTPQRLKAEAEAIGLVVT